MSDDNDDEPTGLERRFERLQRKINGTFNGIDGRLGGIETRLGAIEGKTTVLEARVQATDHRLADNSQLHQTAREIVRLLATIVTAAGVSGGFVWWAAPEPPRLAQHPATAPAVPAARAP